MSAETDRVLAMVKDGTLTPEQATEMLAALRGSTSDAEPAPRPEASHTDSSEAESSRGRHRRRHRRHADFDRVFDDLGVDIERALGAGARTLRWALKSGLQLKGSAWGGDSNSTVLSRADAPSGTDFVCEANELAVSHLRDLRLNQSTFSHNELNAASFQSVELNRSKVTTQRLRGSSIKGGLIDDGELTDNEYNGVGIVNLTINKGRLTGCDFNGAQIRDLGISESVVETSRFNGTKLKTVVIRSDSIVKGLSTNGLLGRNWLLEDAVVSETEFRGIRVDGLVLKHAGLERVVFKTADWTERSDRRPRGLMRDVELQHVILKDCTFEDCRFDGTRLEGFDAANLIFRDVDFTGLVIKSARRVRAAGCGARRCLISRIRHARRARGGCIRSCCVVRTAVSRSARATAATSSPISKPKTCTCCGYSCSAKGAFATWSRRSG